MATTRLVNGRLLRPEDEARIAQMQSVRVVPNRTSLASPWRGQAEYDQSVLGEIDHLDRLNRSRRSHNRLVNIGRFASVAIPTAGVGLSLAGAGAAASAAPAASSGIGTTAGYGSLFTGNGAFLGGGSSVAAPAARFSLGSVLNSPVAGLGVNFLSSWMGNRANSRAQRDALAAQMRQNDAATALERDQIAEQRRQFDTSQADARAAREAENEMRRRELAASEEERAFNRRLVEEREARLAPYLASAERARRTLAQLLGWA